MIAWDYAIFTRLHRFLETTRETIDDRESLVLFTTMRQWWRYHQFLQIILSRYRQDVADCASAEGIFADAPLHLDIESFYLIAKNLLDRIADSFAYVFRGEQWRDKGSTHNMLAKELNGLLARQKLTLTPPELRDLIAESRKRIIGHRNEFIEHPGEPRMAHGTLLSSDGRAAIATYLAHPAPSPKEVAKRQKETEDPFELMALIERYIEAMFTFFETNFDRSELVRGKATKKPSR